MTTAFNNDGYASLVTGMGTFRDPEATAVWRNPLLLNSQQLTEMFVSGGVARRIVEGPAEEMVRPWFTVAGDKGKEVLDVLESIDAQNLVTSAVVWARLYGGSATVFSLAGGNYGSPLGRFRAVNGGRAFDRTQVTLKLDQLSADPARQLLGLPKFIDVTVARGLGSSEGTTVTVHEDRFFLTPGARTPNAMRESTGWDVPLLQYCHDAILRYTVGLGHTSNILRDFVQGVLSVKELSALLASGREEIVRERLQLLDLSRSILNTMLLDADGETYTKSTSSVAGLEGIIDRYLEQLSMACGIPVAKLAGRSAGGLNATGDNDLKNYYDMLASERKRTVAPLVERLVELVYLSADGPTGGTEPENWSIQWNPFFQLTDVEEADLRKKVADTDKIYLDARVLSPAEVANSRFGRGEWTMETEMDETEERATFESMAEEQMALIEAQKNAPAEPGAEGESRGDAAPRSLYVSRRLLNAAEVLRWARAQGLKGLEDASELHVTVTYSKAPVDWMKMGGSWEAELKLPAGGPRLVEQFDGGAIVLLFKSSELDWRHQAMVDAGASWDWPEYQSHVTLSYEAQDISAVEPYTGELVFGPEIFEEIKERVDWIVDQPRVPAGSPQGGQFAKGGAKAGRVVVGKTKIDKKLTEDEVFAIEAYVQESSEFNRSLREQGRVPRSLEDDAELLDSVIARSSLASDMDLYRGISGAIPAEIKPGAVVYDPAYASTSTNRSRAIAFSEDASTNEMGYYLRIYARKGSRGIDVSAAIGDTAEQEILLPRNQKFKVIQVKGKEVYVHAV